MIWKLYECPKCYNSTILCRPSRVRCSVCSVGEAKPWMAIKEWVQ